MFDPPPDFYTLPTHQPAETREGSRRFRLMFPVLALLSPEVRSFM